ncbi:MAG: methylamine utilization protein MauE [Gammaproteobacteria bacterium]|nr:methylamine utilization protein MauE [Gammaproteobacteria bacterium]
MINSRTGLLLGQCLFAAMVLIALPSSARALEPELASSATAGVPGPHWFYVTDFSGIYIFDADSGAMQGKLNGSSYSLSVASDRARNEIYVPASFYTRRDYGERSDFIVVNDFENLAPVHEIKVPDKLAAIGPGNLGLLGGRFLAAYNLTPGMSVSIIDVQERKFVTEISTAGCAMVHPTVDGEFMQMCGDGTLQVITLDESGNEAERRRSKRFFDIDEDPVMDYAVPSADGWILVSYEGLIYQAAFAGGIEIGKPWSLLTEEDVEDGWRIGGDQPLAYNSATGVLAVLMHKGEKDTHKDPGTELWVYDFANRRRGYRLALEAPVSAVEMTSANEPLLLLLGEGPVVAVHNATTGRHIRTIKEAGISGWGLQRFWK